MGSSPQARCSLLRPSCRCTSRCTSCRCATPFSSPDSSPRSRSLPQVGFRSVWGSAARTVTRSRSAGSIRRRVDAGWTKGFASCEPWLRVAPVTFDGEFFTLEDALVLPAPCPAIPLIVGGRSDAAVNRAAMLGDGWLGIWVSPRRYGTVSDQIARKPRRLAGTRAGSSTPSTSGVALAPRARQHVNPLPRRCRPSTSRPSSCSSATRRTAHQSRWRSSCAPTSKPAARPST